MQKVGVRKILLSLHDLPTWKEVAYWHLRGSWDREKSNPPKVMEHLQGARQLLQNAESGHMCEEDLLWHDGLLLSSRQCLLKAGQKTTRMREIILRDSGLLLQGGSCWRLEHGRNASRHSYKASGSSLSPRRRTEKSHFILIPFSLWISIKYFEGGIGTSPSAELRPWAWEGLSCPLVIQSLHTSLCSCWGFLFFLLLYSQLLVLQSVSLLPVSRPSGSSHYLALNVRLS